MQTVPANRDKAGNDVINILTSAVRINGKYWWILRVVYFLVKHYGLYNKCVYLPHPQKRALQISSLRRGNLKFWEFLKLIQSLHSRYGTIWIDWNVRYCWGVWNCVYGKTANVRLALMLSWENESAMRILQNKLTFDANTKLLNFTEKLKTASGKCRINVVTWSSLPFAVSISVILNLPIIFLFIQNISYSKHKRKRLLKKHVMNLSLFKATIASNK